MWKFKRFSPAESTAFQERFLLARTSAGSPANWVLFYNWDAPAGVVEAVMTPAASAQLGPDWEDFSAPESKRLGILVWDEAQGDAWAQFGLQRP